MRQKISPAPPASEHPRLASAGGRGSGGPKVGMSRLFNPPRPVQVRTDDAGAPIGLLWRGRWEPVRVSNRWRLEDEWWRQGGEVVRDYYRLRTASGTVCVVFRDEVAGDWRLERILD